MKNLLTTLTLLITLLLSGCDKTIFDYRHKYIGDYEFKIVVSCYPSCTPPPCDTSYIYFGNIEYAENIDKVVIHYTDGYSIEPMVDHDGNISQHFGHYQSDDLGKFINKNEIQFEVSYGGLGCRVFHTVKGVKK